MMKKWKQIFITAVLFGGLVGGTMLAPVASAINVFDECSSAPSDNAVCKGRNDEAAAGVKNIINLLLYIIGIIAVIMIIVGGIRYATSNGNSSQIKEAKDTILYAVIGLIVAIISFTIVNFVVDWFIPRNK